MAHKNERLVFIVLLHECGVFKPLEHGRFSLNAGVGDVANFVAVESSPMLAIVAAMKWQNVPVIDKVDKRIAPIAPVLEVNRKIEKIDDSWAMSIFRKFRQKHLLRVLVWNISNHE